MKFTGKPAGAAQDLSRFDKRGDGGRPLKTGKFKSVFFNLCC
jgi:hypothetical protein